MHLPTSPAAQTTGCHWIRQQSCSKSLSAMQTSQVPLLKLRPSSSQDPFHSQSTSSRLVPDGYSAEPTQMMSTLAAMRSALRLHTRARAVVKSGQAPRLLMTRSVNFCVWTSTWSSNRTARRVTNTGFIPKTRQLRRRPKIPCRCWQCWGKWDGFDWSLAATSQAGAKRILATLRLTVVV